MSSPQIYERRTPQVLIVEDDDIARGAYEGQVSTICRHLGYETQPILTPHPSPQEATIDMLTAMEDNVPIAVVLVNFTLAFVEDMSLLETSRDWHPYASHIVLYSSEILEPAQEAEDGTLIRPAVKHRQYESVNPAKLARLGTPQEYWLNSEEPKEGDERTLADWILDRSQYGLTFGPVLTRAFEFFEYRYEQWLAAQEDPTNMLDATVIDNSRPASEFGIGPRKIDTPVLRNMRPDAPSSKPDFFIRIKGKE